MPKWIREILASAGIAVGTITVFAVAIAFGVFAATKIGDWNPWVAGAVAAGVLLVIGLSVAIWWLRIRSR